jgi:hypothetical protein
MKIYNAIMSSILTGLIAHELTHAVFYQRMDYIGFVFSKTSVAEVCGLTAHPNTEVLAWIVQIIAMVVVFYLTLRSRREKV